MTRLTVLPLAALAIRASASVLPQAIPRDANEPGFLSFPVVRRRNHIGTLIRRDDDVSLINASDVSYLFQIQIGTPPQAVDVVLDTGSFELWVDPTCSAAPTPGEVTACYSAGTYNPDSSSTVVDIGLANVLPYGKGKVEIAYVEDSIVVPGTSSQTLKNVVFGVGMASEELPFGICGVGHGYNYNLIYRNFIDVLASNGVTNSKAFSVALGSQSANNGGVVIFGGLDTKKFTGKLYQFANLPPQVEGTAIGPWRYWIQMNSVGITKPGSRVSVAYPSTSIPVVLDTGSTLSYLPASIIQQLASDFSATVQSDGALQVPCSTASQAGSVDFTFGSLTIHVPYREFIWQQDSQNCYVGALPIASGGTALLGDSFLRSAYVVFDQTNQNIFLAQYANCGQNEQTLPADAGAAANFTGQCSSSSSSSAAARGTVRGDFWAVLAAVAFGLQVCMLFLL